MCIVDRIYNPTCNHSTYHLLMACSRPKVSHAQSEFEYCTQPTYRTQFSSSEFSCIVCKKGGAGIVAADASAKAGKENAKAELKFTSSSYKGGDRKENVKGDMTAERLGWVLVDGKEVGNETAGKGNSI